MKEKFSTRTQLLLLLLITALTRLPFIFDGFGVEEDSWGLVVNAYEMHSAGHYIASRFPGHPVEEYAYLAVYNSPAWVYNLLSLLTGTAAVGFFFLALKKMQLHGAFATALIFCFTPVFFISGTYTIDFSWTMAFVMASFYLLLDGKLVWSGVLLGIATGCRITSEIFLLPWAILLWSRLDVRSWFLKMLRVGIPAALVGAAMFIPAYLQYGKDFFDYSDQFPYPPLAKVFYKATLGVFGLIGGLALLIALFPAFRNWRKKEMQAVTLFSTERLLLVCLVVIVLHVISYLRLPQKSGYLVPLIPFTALFFALLLKEKQLRMVAFAFLLAPFLFSINLTDALRGADSSAWAKTVKISGQEIFIDPFSGPVLSERSKRRRKMEYCQQVLATATKQGTPSLLVCGWWYNELLTEYFVTDKKVYRKLPQVELRFYVPCSTLDSARRAGRKIYYLQEQNLYNDQMYGQNCTDSLAGPFPVK